MTSTGHGACQRDDQRFSQQLPAQSSGTGTECETDTELLLAFGGASEQQIGQIRADDEQQKAAGTHENR